MQIDNSIHLGIQWIKRTFINEELGWARSRKDYEELKGKTGYGCNPCSTAESVEILAYLGEPLYSEFIRKGLAWFMLNKEKWLEQDMSVDFLIWALHAIRLSNSTIANELLEEGLKKLNVYRIIDSNDPSLKNLVAERPVFPLPKKEPLKVRIWGLYSTALTIKLFTKLLPKFQLENGIKLLKNPLLYNYIDKEKGWPIYPIAIAQEQNIENPADVFYTSLIVDAFLDSGEPLSCKYVVEPLKMIKDKQLKSGGWAGIWPQKEHGIETKYGDTETTSQVVITLLKCGLSPYSKLIQKGIAFILSNQAREKEERDFGGFRLFRKEELETVFNFSTFMALTALEFYRHALQYAKSVREVRIENKKKELRKYEYACLNKQIFLTKETKMENKIPPFIIKYMEEKEQDRRLKILKYIDEEGPTIVRDLEKKFSEREKVNRKTIKYDIEQLINMKLAMKLKVDAKEYLWTFYDIKE